MEKTRQYKKKICLLGSFSVGKTSLVERFVHHRFDDKYLTTIGVKVSQKRLAPVVHSDSGAYIQYTLLIWDIAGMEKFDASVKNYYRGAAAALAVSDLTRPETAIALEEICLNFRKVCPEAPLLFIGNKKDLFEGEETTIHALDAAAFQFGGNVLLTSAKTGEHVEDSFFHLAQEIGTHGKDRQEAVGK